MTRSRRKRTKMKLNVGCGWDAWGDIRVDITNNYLGKRTNLKMVADANYLPFRDKVFQELRAYHIID